MLVGRMIGNEIEQQLEPAGVDRRKQPVEAGEITKDWIDAAIVSDVVSEIRHGRGINRRQPDRIDAKVGEIIQPRLDSGKVAHAIRIAILKRSGVDLIDHPALPPRSFAATLILNFAHPIDLSRFVGVAVSIPADFQSEVFSNGRFVLHCK